MNKALKITLISLFIVSILVVTLFIYNVLNKPNIYNGVKIQNIEVGGLSRERAKEDLKSRLDEELQNKEIAIIGSEYSKNIKYKDLGIEYDYSKAVGKAHEIGRRGNILSRLKDIYDVSFKGENVDLEIKKNSKKIEEVVSEIDKEVSKDKKDATISLINGRFIIGDEVVGKIVDKQKLEAKIDASINNFDSVEIPIKLDKPEATKELLSQVKDEIGTYSTQFTLNDANRVYNIKRSSDSVDNKVVLPGEIFSFNAATGPRSLKAGYKEATVILNGEFVPGEGGGVCQVSSTLYNTLLDSKVNIVERHTHSLPVSYVPPGKDATVAYDILDLRFKNNYNDPIYIKSNVTGNVLTIKLYGNKDSKR